MAERSRSLWTLVPERVRWSLVPVFSSAFLVGAGEELGRALIYVFGETPASGEEVNPAAAGDATAILLLVNLMLALWVFDRVLGLEIAEAPDKVDLPARFINFATIFVSVADLLKLALAPKQEAYIALYGVVAVVYLLFVPFVLVRVADPGGGSRAKADAALLRGFLRMAGRTTAYGTTMVVAVTAIVGVFFVVMNDGVQPLSLLGPVDTAFGQANRNDFWLINPMLMAVPALQLCFLRFGDLWTGAGVAHAFEIPRWGRRVLVAVSVAIILLLATVMLGKCEMLQQGSEPAPPFDAEAWMRAVQGVTGMLYAAAFFAAFFVGHGLMSSREDGARPPFGWVAALTVFALAGAAAGGIVLAARAVVSADPLAPVQYHLLWMHAVSFALAFLGLAAGGRFLARRVAGMAPLLPVGGAARR